MDKLFNEDGLIIAESYQQTIVSVVLPALEKAGREERLTAPDGTALYCVSYDAVSPRGTVLIVHGFTENAYKYAELINAFLRNGYSVVAYDQRGHGRSGRSEGLSDMSLTHVERFGDYVSDMKAVVDGPLCRMPGPRYLFAHSMGGAVAALFMERYPDVFTRAVLSSPMIEPETAGYPTFVAAAVAFLACAVGKGKKKPFFMDLYRGPEDFAASCATDPARFQWYDQVKAERQEFHNTTPTYRWSFESTRVRRAILAAGRPESISCPVLLCAAGNDTMVRRAPQKAFIDRVPQGKMVVIDGAKHEIYRSEDRVLMPWWRQVMDFYRAEGA